MDNNGLIYGLEERPPLKDTLFAALQHLLAIFVAVITPPLKASQKIDRKATLVIAISFSMGLGVELYPEILSQFPEAVKNIFSSGITTGGLAAIISNMVIRIKEE